MNCLRSKILFEKNNLSKNMNLKLAVFFPVFSRSDKKQLAFIIY